MKCYYCGFQGHIKNDCELMKAHKHKEGKGEKALQAILQNQESESRVMMSHLTNGGFLSGFERGECEYQSGRTTFTKDTLGEYIIIIDCVTYSGLIILIYLFNIQHLA